MEHRLVVILLAYLLDLAFGDPAWSWHPVRLMGRLITGLESRLNRDTVNRRRAGVLLVVLVVSAAVASVWLILRLSMAIHPAAHLAVSALFVYFTISVKDLSLHAGRVSQALLRKDLKQARQDLSMIAGRDTRDLSEQEVVRATVETVGESIMDGIVSPLFYAFLGGPVLAWAYKAINTLDSMVGYNNQKFKDFGRASAGLDGWANFIPAKLTSALIFICGLGCGRGWRSPARWLAKYLLKGPKYNSQSTEAVMAGVLGVRLGGLNFYDSVPVQKDFIGDGLIPLETRHIKESIKIAYASSSLFVGMGLLLTWISGGR